MTSLTDHLASKLQPYQGRRWRVAFSGGLDSTVLLHALAALQPTPLLQAIHIHHGLQAQADDWQQHCAEACAGLGIEYVCLKVTVEPGASQENAARQARYQAFEEALEDGDLLLQAHHLDDQIETMLLRLFRGTGLEGLRGIPETRPLGAGLICRPLLALPRAELAAYAQVHGLHWVDDPSNSDSRFDRNFLRTQVLPLIAQRWPGYRGNMARFSGLVEASIAIEERWAVEQSWLAGVGHVDRSPFPIAALTPLNTGQRQRLLRHWLAQWQIVPTLAQVQSVLEAAFAEPGAQPLVELAGKQLRRFQDHLYVTALVDFDPQARWHWDGAAPLVLPGAGCLTVERGASAEPLTFTVTFRQGGERFQPEGRAHSQQMKKLLQEAAIPPWRRGRLPLIFVGDELVAVAGLGVHQQWAARLSGWRFHWRPED